MLNKVLLIFLCVLLKMTPCICYTFDRIDEKLLHSSSVENKYLQQICEKYQLQITSVGGGCLNGVELLSCGGRVVRELSINEARNIIIDVSEIMLNIINSDKKIRPHLKVFPFPVSSITFSIYVDIKDVDPYLRAGNLASCSLINGQIRYKTIKNGVRFYSTNQTELFLTESYEEAKEIIKNERK